MSWRALLIGAAGVLVVLVGFAIVSWDPIKVLCAAILCLVVALFPTNR